MTGMSYIGVTTQTVASRCVQHRKVAGYGTPYPLSQAIRDYGWKAFDVTELGRASSKQELAEMERSAIALYKTLAPHGYNLTPGGPGTGSPSLATREKLRQAGLGRPAWNKGIPHTPEARAKVAASRTGGKNWGARPLSFDGKTYACIKDACQATGLSRHQICRRIKLGFGQFLTESRRGPDFAKWNTGRKASPETRRKMSEARPGAKHYHPPAILIDGVAYPSITDAARDSDYSYMQLKTRLKDGRATYLTTSRYIQ